MNFRDNFANYYSLINYFGCLDLNLRNEYIQARRNVVDFGWKMKTIQMYIVLFEMSQLNMSAVCDMFTSHSSVMGQF